MPTFTVPTEAGAPPVEEIGHSKAWSLWRFFADDSAGFIPVARTVVITSSTAAPLATEGARTFSVDDFAAADSGSGDGGQAVFSHGATYTISAAEDTALTAAGYTTT